MMALLRKAILPVLVIAGGVVTALVVADNSPEIETTTPVIRLPAVGVIEAQPQDTRLSVTTHGTVTPQTEIDLVTEVSGKIVEVSSEFVAGGFFEAGEWLLTIDARDYELAVTRAEAGVSEARQLLVREKAEAQAAAREWSELGNSSEAPALVLRKPQLAEAYARLKAAKVDLDSAKLNLERTRLHAPFAGRLRQTRAGLGQYVVPGAALARLYSIDIAEVRLPLNDRQLQHLNLPLDYRNRHTDSQPPVTLRADFAGASHQWQGRIIRLEGDIDLQSRQLYVVAQVQDPYAGKTGGNRPPLAVGMFVEARIEGRLYEQVYALPPTALRRNNGLLIVRDSKLQLRNVDVLHSESERIIVADGLQPGEHVVVTPLTDPLPGMQVQLSHIDHILPASTEPSAVAQVAR